MEDRRSESRLSWGAKIRIEDASTKRLVSADARLRNITKHGFGFVTEDHLTKGALYLFKMDLNGTSFDVNARVVHFHIDATYYLCGARIEGLSLLQRSRVNHFLASKSAALQRKFLLLSILVGVAAAVGIKLIAGAATGIVVAVFVVVALLAFVLLPF